MALSDVAQLNSYPWKIHYASDSGNPVADFYIPALERAIQYDRKSGFFSSAILSQVAGGLGAILHNAGPQQGKMRLIMGCQLTKADLAAIQQGYALRDAVAANLQPILAQAPTFIEQATISVDPEEEDVLLSEFDTVLEMPPLRPALDDMVRMDVEADLKEIQQPLPAAPVTPSDLEARFTRSLVLGSKGIVFSPAKPGVYELKWMNQAYLVAFDPLIFEDSPSLRLMIWGDPLFQAVLSTAL